MTRLFTILFLVLGFLNPSVCYAEAADNLLEVFSKKAADYATNFENGDAGAIANDFQKEGTYRLADGTVLEGRADIKLYFETYFQEFKPEPVIVKVTSVKELVPGKAVIETGTTQLKDEKKPSSRYKILHVNKNGQWKIAWAEETAIITDANLKNLSWLKGKWKADVDIKTPIKVSIKKVAKGNFLQVSNKANGNKVLIGVDPRSGSIHSWHFSSSGGIGEGDWQSSGDSWVINTSGVTGDGFDNNATYKLTKFSNDKFSWSSTDRSIDGQSIPDLAEVKLTREAEAN